MNELDRLLRESLTEVRDSYAEERQGDLFEARARFIERYRRRRRFFAIGSVALAGAAVLAVGAIATGRVALFADGSPDVAGRPGEGILARVPTGQRPVDIALRPEGVWVVNEGDSTLARIDPESNEVTAELSLAGRPQEVDLGDSAVWVAGFGRITAIDPTSGDEIDSVDLGAESDRMVLSVGDGGVWAIVGARDLYNIDPQSLDAQPVPVVERPVDVMVRDGSVWVLDARRGLLRLDPKTTEPVGRPIGQAASSTGDLHGGNGIVWIAAKDDDTIIQVDATTGVYAGDFQVPGIYVDMAVTESVAWVISRSNGVALLNAIDPVSGEPLSDPMRLPRGAGEVGAGERGVWITDVGGQGVIRIDTHAALD